MQRRGLVKNTILCPPETTSGFRPRREKKKNTVKFLFKIGTACRVFKENAHDSWCLILRSRERERDGSTLFSTIDSLKFRTGFEKSSAPLMKIAPDINRRSMKPQTEFVPIRIRFFISGLERHVSLLSIILYDASVFVARNDID